jgi:Ca2+-binding RTX toxin-like protein
LTLTGSALATIDASTATGTLNITDGNSAANETITGPATAAMTVQGGSGADSITGGAAGDSITGGAGNDTILGNAGNDTIVNGAGVDSLVAGDGTDTLSQTGWTIGTTLDGGSTAVTGTVVNLGSTSITAAAIAGHIGNTVVVNQLNADISTVAPNTAGVLGVVATVSARVDTISGFENVTGSTGKDYIVGSSSANTINPGTGADVVLLGAGADTYVAIDGDSIAATAEGATDAAIVAGESFTFGNGVDVIASGFTAGAGGDVLDLVPASAAPTAMLGAGIAALLAGATVGYISGSYNASTGAFTFAANGAGADTLILDGTAAADRAFATANTWIVLVGVNSADLVAANFG